MLVQEAIDLCRKYALVVATWFATFDVRQAQLHQHPADILLSGPLLLLSRPGWRAVQGSFTAALRTYACNAFLRRPEMSSQANKLAGHAAPPGLHSSHEEKVYQ